MALRNCARRSSHCKARAANGELRLNYDRSRQMRSCLALLALIVAALAPPVQAQQVLRWGGDAEGGAPFVEADPRDPSRLVGFDVEIAELIARQLGRTPQFLQVQFTSLDQSAKRGDFDIGLSGIEDIPADRISGGGEAMDIGPAEQPSSDRATSRPDRARRCPAIH